MKLGKVYLVGAGPGDPALITVKGERALRIADCVFFDHLASEELLDHAPRSAERLYVGKKRSNHTFAQEEITTMLIERARAGKTVVRLKGGDPYLFGRGGEEAEALFDAGIAFEVIPGVTSPLGIAAYTGVPLTHRDHTSVVTFVTGHGVEKIDWGRFGVSETLVIFMGLSSFDAIAQEILAAGRPLDTPAIAVRWGTRPDQEVIEGTLETLPGLIHARAMKPPATIIVGAVASLRGKLNWFDRLPLAKQRVVVTRPAAQAAALADPLRALGAQVFLLPSIEIAPPFDPRALDAAITHLHTYDWVLFTSANGVSAFLDRLRSSPVDVRSLRGKLAAIGPATARALESAHLKPDVVADEFVAEGLLAALSGYDLAGKKVLLARAAVARDVLPSALTARGASVDVVEAYRSIAPEGLRERAISVFAHAPDWVTFTSSSTALNLAEAIGLDTLRKTRIASIGPVTSATLRDLGLEVHAEAEVFTVEGLVSAIVAQSTSRPPQ